MTESSEINPGSADDSPSTSFTPIEARRTGIQHLRVIESVVNRAMFLGADSGNVQFAREYLAGMIDHAERELAALEPEPEPPAQEPNRAKRRAKAKSNG